VFLGDVHTGRLVLFACPPQYTSFIYLHIGPAPCRQTNIDASYSSSECCCIKRIKNRNDANGKSVSGGYDAVSNQQKTKLMPTKIKQNQSAVLASGKNYA